MYKVLFVYTFLVLMVPNSLGIETKTNSSTTTSGHDEKIRAECPLYGIDFKGGDLNEGGGLVTSSWEECGKILKREDIIKFIRT